ncbi:MAG: inositol monophosphatase family protein [Humidesulfovibrio sp.]|uniref:inositol monophosphatase family protein n=1 Tax=Humidesulfovibrio sp. TaxID=2910988 RepID=UPI0027FE1C23|nr:inositol monophosphatase family protein [Humidesulfovibrio sp.]MDQ7834420.1 inositol monophosphatase family protein [Humidesulfovibrio sp.]
MTPGFPPEHLSHLLERTALVVSQSGEIIREHDLLPRRIRHKASPKDLVTETDIAVELFLREHLGALVPEAGFLGEEGSSGLGLDGLAWVVDPVDGTTNFAHGVPFVATSVALCLDGAPLIGVVNLPLLGELYSAGLGLGSFCNAQPIHVSDTATLLEALVATGFPYRIEEHQGTILRQLALAMPATQGVRRAGAAALDLAFVACGRYDGFFEFALNPWDTAAGVLLIQEAGGRVGRIAADVPYRLGDPDILVSNAQLESALRALLTQACAPAAEA